MSKIILVGFGPGSHDQMTYRAKAAIEESDVVIGYSTYIKLVLDLLEGKEVIKKGMTEEIDRCELALAKAEEGKTVALISSGDIGIYGMAGPLYEYLFTKGWTPTSKVKVEVVPGVTALSASASLVGAPLTHDFCSISLSDLLTPWNVIATRLDAVGKADFVIALYNPKSSRRSGQIEEATRILLKHKSPETPVALVKSAYRKKEKIVFCELKDLANQEIGMLTTVLIGNKSTILEHDLLVTPRGYANKYDFKGAVLEGEEAGISLSTGLNSLPKQVLDFLKEGGSPTKLEAKFGLPLGDVLLQLDENRLEVTEVVNVSDALIDRALGDYEELQVTGFKAGIETFNLSLENVNLQQEQVQLAIKGKDSNILLEQGSWSKVLTITMVEQTHSKQLFLLDASGNLAYLLSYH